MLVLGADRLEGVLLLAAVISPRTVASTEAACSPPITEIRALGPSTGTAANTPARTSSSCPPVGAADDDGELGHRAQATAGHHLGAVLGDAARLVVAADHEPVMFCGNTSGTTRFVAQFDEMRPLTADSPNSTPLLATMPTGWPWMWANPVTSVVPYSALNSLNSPPSTMRVITS